MSNKLRGSRPSTMDWRRANGTPRHAAVNHRRIYKRATNKSIRQTFNPRSAILDGMAGIREDVEIAEEIFHGARDQEDLVIRKARDDAWQAQYEAAYWRSVEEEEMDFHLPEPEAHDFDYDGLFYEEY